MGSPVNTNRPTTIPPGQALPITAEGKAPEQVGNAKVEAQGAPKPDVQFTTARNSDTVEKGAAKKNDLALGEPELPEGEGKVTTMPKQQQQAGVEALVGTLTDIAKEMATPAALQQILSRAGALQANPALSLVAQILGPDYVSMVMNGIPGMAATNQETIQLAGEHFGPEAAQFLQNYMTQTQSFFVSALSPESGGGALSLTEGQLEKGLESIKEVFAFLAPSIVGGAENTRQMSEPTLLVTWNPEDGSAPDPTMIEAFSGPGRPQPLGADGKPLTDPAKIATLLAQIMATGEAALEFMLGLAGKLAQGDQLEHLKMLQASLEGLKKQKLGLMQKVIGKEAELQGSEYQGAVQADEARRAAESGKNCAVVGAVFAVIAAVIIAVIAVVLAVVTFGAFSAGSALMIFGAVTMAAGAVTASVAVCTIIVAVCAVITAVMTIITQMPNLLRFHAMIFKAMGLEGLAAALDDAADWYEKNLTSLEWFKTLNMVVTLSVGLIGAVCSFGMATGTGVASACISLASAAASAGVAVGTYSANAAMIEANYAVALLKGQLAKVEVAVKMLLAEVTKVRHQEDNENQRVQDSEEQLQNIMKNIAACTDKLAEIRTTVSEL